MRLITKIFILSLLMTSMAFASPTPWHPEIKVLISQALSSMDRDDLEDTIVFHKAILKKQPDNLFSINSISEIYGTLGKYNDQILWAMKAIAIDGNDDAAYVNYGNGLLGLGKIDQAKSAYDRALEINAHSSTAIYSLGLIADQQNDYLTAIGFYKKSIEFDPFFEKGYFRLAMDYAHLKEYAEAVNSLNILLNLNPDADNAKQMLSAIERIKFRASASN